MYERCLNRLRYFAGDLRHERESGKRQIWTPSCVRMSTVAHQIPSRLEPSPAHLEPNSSASDAAAQMRCFLTRSLPRCSGGDPGGRRWSRPLGVLLLLVLGRRPSCWPCMACRGRRRRLLTHGRAGRRGSGELGRRGGRRRPRSRSRGGRGSGDQWRGRRRARTRCWSCRR